MLLHGSVYGMGIEYPEDSTPWLAHIIHSVRDIPPLMERMQQVDLAAAGLVLWHGEAQKEHTLGHSQSQHSNTGTDNGSQRRGPA